MEGGKRGKRKKKGKRGKKEEKRREKGKKKGEEEGIGGKKGRLQFSCRSLPNPHIDLSIKIFWLFNM